MSTEVRTTLDAGLRTSNGAIGNLLTVVTEARRLPLIPIVILMVVLIVPAIFAMTHTNPRWVWRAGWSRRCGRRAALPPIF